MKMNKLSVLYIMIAGILWGTSGIFTTNLREFGFDSLQMASARNVVAAVCMLIFSAVTLRRKMRISFKRLLLIAVSGVGLYGTGAFYYAAMKAASLSVAVVLMYLAPVIVMIVSVLFMGESFTCIKGIAIVAALVGTALVTGIIGGLRVSVMGIILGVLSGISYSIYNICVKLEMRRGDNPIIATTYCFVFAAILSLFFANPVTTVKMTIENPAQILPWILPLGVVTSVIPYLVYTYAMKKIPAGVATAMGSVEPLTATLVSIIFYNEPITVFSVIGIFLILGAVVMLSFSEE